MMPVEGDGVPTTLGDRAQAVLSSRGWSVPTLSERVTEWVGHEVLNGRWQAGRRVTEKEVAEALEVSRQPVREAFRALAENGVLELVPRVGAIVAPFDAGVVREIYQLRIVVEGWLVAEAIPRLSDKAVEDLHVATSEVARLRNAESRAFYESGWHLRCYLYSQSGNSVAVEVASQLRRRLRSFPRVVWEDDEQRVRALQLHDDLLSSCREREASGGREVIEDYLRTTCATVMSYMADDVETSPDR